MVLKQLDTHGRSKGVQCLAGARERGASFVWGSGSGTLNAGPSLDAHFPMAWNSLARRFPVAFATELSEPVEGHAASDALQ